MTIPTFNSRAFLRDHMRSVLDFYEPSVIDPNGGLRQNYRRDGTPFDDANKHLVSSCRMVFNYCLADRLFGTDRYRELWQFGAQFVRDAHWQPERGGYTWTISSDSTDETNHCYGLAFVVLMNAMLVERGDAQARSDLETAWSIMENRFWQADAGLYADEASPNWSALSEYRGQNANMHACEAAIFAFEATGETRYIERASELATTIARHQADKSDGLVWEHFKQDLSLDWDYNRDDPANLYRPWGFQPGHQTEWSKLLLMLNRHAPADWLVERAARMFTEAMTVAWDEARGGIYYGFAPDKSICDDQKYFWVQAETMAAAAMLGAETGEDEYWNWYQRIWEYCWAHFVDHEFGAWHRVLDTDNVPLDDIKSAAGAKCDYHNLSACATALECVPG